MSTLTRAGRILDLFDRDHPEWGVSEVARRLNLSKGSVSSQMATLAEIGLLRRTPARRYRLGWKLFVYSRALGDSDVGSLATPVVDSWAARTGELVNVVVRLGQLALRVCGGIPSARYERGVSERDLFAAQLPAHATSGGKVLLAYGEPLNDRFWTAFGNLERMTSKTLTNVDLLREELDLVRARGFAIDFEESAIGICCVAAPIWGPSAEVIAALTIPTDKKSFLENSRQLTDYVLRASQEISRELMTS